MNIIFKKTLAITDQKYTILDLDTFRLADGSIHTACCVIENMPIDELPIIENLKELHANLIANYGQKNWVYCENALEQLIGKWGGELDSFYQELKTRIKVLKTLNLTNEWSPIMDRV
jgi:hypothetical protein